MPDRFIRPLKFACFVLAVLLLAQIGLALRDGNPLGSVVIPPLPTLPGETNSIPTNGPAMAAAADRKPVNAQANGTNIAKLTNAPNPTNIVSTTNASNSVAGRGRGGRRGAPDLPAGLPPELMAMMGGGGRGGPKMELPADIQARVDRIVNGELLGPVMHPMPMALLGIADDEAYLRATNGQTGPLKVGKEMGGVTLLKIGINRVLVETGGETRELTLFGGVGSESLMPKTPDPSPANSISPMASVKNMKTNQTDAHSLRSSKPKETP